MESDDKSAGVQELDDPGKVDNCVMLIALPAENRKALEQDRTWYGFRDRFSLRPEAKTTGIWPILVSS
jgi:hypothetical protein